MNLEKFKQGLHLGIKELFKNLEIPVNPIDEKTIKPKEIFDKTYKDNEKDNESFQLMEDVIAFGMVNDSAFLKETKETRESLDNIRKNKKEDYDGILVFAVTLKKRSNGLLPTRSQLAEITRAFNREYNYISVIVVFRYDNYISIANAERITYQQKWREGEKIGKVSLLRDISISSPHKGHLKILQELKISRSGSAAINSFKSLYKHWQEVLSISILNKWFYKELSDWYFWAMREVHFPNAPEQEEKIKEHNATNLIRLLTRILFIWFIKEKELIPEELFNKKKIEKLLNSFEPQKKSQKGNGSNHKTQDGYCYYRAVLQNLFFATLNQDMEKREFRNPKQNMNATTLMRYESYFKDPEIFIKLINVVPFMNGGLFECLDKPREGVKGKMGGPVIKYIDGFSDRDDNQLRVPDYIFFEEENHVDLSGDYGQGEKKHKDVKVKGLIKILESYKFTIDENTPIEQDIALDPELLGRVFENLLASYNPETKTTARKQTGSFYTPREIVNYMVDESLIAHLKTSLEKFPKNEEKESLNEKLHQLLSYDSTQPFENKDTKETIIKAIDECKIFDPACGSGAFPMGALQKMVHILKKVDPNNDQWKERQIKKARAIDDIKIRDKLINDIKEAFENNELDYGRKLYLIENCIYGADIQPIAVQISKLRFFISLIVDQKVDKNKENLGIIPLPNLEIKFVAANTLMGVEIRAAEGESVGSTLDMLDRKELHDLKIELKDVRHRSFSAKTPKTKRDLRKEDKELRENMAKELKNNLDNETARQLAEWDPYDQNASSPFFDSDWMFGIANGFDVVIGNPPYVQLQKDSGKLADMYKSNKFETYKKKGDIYTLFYEKGILLLKNKGDLCFITSNKWMRAGYGKSLRSFFLKHNPKLLINLGPGIFESATVDTNILIVEKNGNRDSINEINKFFGVALANKAEQMGINSFVSENKIEMRNLNEQAWFIGSLAEYKLKEKIEKNGKPLKNWDVKIYRGILTGCNDAFIISSEKREEILKNCKTEDEKQKTEKLIKPVLRGKDIKKYHYQWAGLWLIATFPVLHIDIEKYPAVKKYLLNFGKEKLKQEGQKLPDGTKSRKKTNNKWFETQDQIGYYSEFEKEKLVYSEIVRSPQFYLDNEKYFCEATTFLMTGNNLKYICGLLNSNFIACVFKKYYAGGGLGEDGYRYKKAFLEKLPIPQITSTNQSLSIEIESLVDQILTITKSSDYQKNLNKQTQVKEYEKQIDKLVCRLYNLTEDEIKVIETNV